MKNLLRSKKVLAAIAIALLIVILIPIVIFAAVTDQSPVGIAGKLKFQGSTTVGPIIQRASADYNTFRGSTVITNDASNIVQNGSGDGRNSAIQHKTDIGMSSGSLSSSELLVLSDYYIARDGVVMVVNTNGTTGCPADVTVLTKAQIQGIYQGTFTNWNQVGSATSRAITPRARIIGSGTRASLKDQCTITLLNPDVDPSYPATGANENATIVNTRLAREASNESMQADINAGNGNIGYVGLGFDTGANIRALQIKDDNNVAWSPTGVNIYALNPAISGFACYPLARFLHLCPPKDITPANASDITNFITWIKATDGKGQDAVVAEGFLRLIPNQDVTKDNSVDVSDLVAVGNKVGQTGAAHWDRADVTADGSVDVSDLVAVGNWVGTSILPAN